MLKHEHTIRVCSDMDKLCESISLEKNMRFLAKIVALFHDVGRFKQYQDYGTFQDRKSVNHSEIGLQIISENHLFSDLPEDYSQMIQTAIFYHNVKTIPDNLKERQKLLCNLIRDADKLDIYYIAAQLYTNYSENRKDIIETGLPDLPTVSPEICSSITKGSIGDFSKIKCLNDFKLIQIGWVYDLNIPYSFRLIKERGHFETIKNQLPDIPEVNYAVELAQNYLHKRAAQKQ